MSCHDPFWFWTTDADRDTCGDTSEDEYTFSSAHRSSAALTNVGEALKAAVQEAFLEASCAGSGTHPD